MAVFAYTALDRNGQQQKGTLPADSRAAAMDLVQSRGLSPLSVEEQLSEAAARQPAKSTSTRVPMRALESFTREMANLLAAGLPLSRALQLMKREASHPGAKNVWGQIHDDVIGGVSLADALAKWPKTFSTVYVAMVRAGEAGGFLPIVLTQISDFRTREQELKGKVKAAMVYPAVLSLFAVGVVIFLLTWFLPKFSGLFAEFGGNLPWLTQMIVLASDAIKKYGIFIAAAIVGIVFAVKKASTTDGGLRFIEKVILHTPVLGLVAARFALVRFARMLGTLVGAGVPLVASLKVAKAALGNQTFADAVSHAVDEVQRGTSLSKSLSGNPLLFPASVIEMISVAEETGRLDKELVRLSVAYEGDLDRNLRILVSLAEPILLFAMAGVIGTIVVGMLLPVFTLQDLIK